MSAALASLPAHEIAARVAAGESAALEVVEAFLARIEAVDPRLGAFLEVYADAARDRAERVDRARAAGGKLGPLAGVPVALKDNFAHRGHPTTCASRILAGYRSPYTATAVARLEAAGAIPIGRTNMDEFAMGSSTEHSALQVTRNPFDLERTPGGSSGGSAAAVAARMAPLALGSDTGGSVRQPAALCGVPGLKPTYGRISRHGLVAFASSLDHVAPLGRCVRDLARALTVLAGPDPRDSTSLDAPVPDYEQALAGDIEGLRLGVPEDLLAKGLDAEVAARFREALGVLESRGAAVVTVELPHARYALPTYYVLCMAEASSNLARYDGVRYGRRTGDDLDVDSMYERTRTEGFGEEVRHRILLGAFCLCRGYYDAWYGKASRVRARVREDFERAFTACNVIATPTSPVPAFRLGEKLDDPLSMYLCDTLTAPANLAGLPAISVPCGFTAAGLPVGLQLLAPALGEEVLLRAAAAYEAATGHHLEEPTP